MEENIIYENNTTKVILDGPIPIFIISGLLNDYQDEPEGSAAILLYPEELAAIHAAIHADDEPAVAEKATCGSCEYFIGNMCRRYPPVSVYSPPYGDDPLPWSPAVFEDEWCGEHRPANRANPVDRGVKWPEEVE